MKEVAAEEFLAALKADNRDIMPHIVSGYNEIIGYIQDWTIENRSTALWGRTYSGDGIGRGKKYFLA